MKHTGCTHSDMINTLEVIGFKPIGFMVFTDGNREVDLNEVPLEELDQICTLLGELK